MVGARGACTLELCHVLLERLHPGRDRRVLKDHGLRRKTVERSVKRLRKRKAWTPRTQEEMLNSMAGHMRS